MSFCQNSFAVLYDNIRVSASLWSITCVNISGLSVGILRLSSSQYTLGSVHLSLTNQKNICLRVGGCSQWRSEINALKFSLLVGSATYDIKGRYRVIHAHVLCY